MKVLCCSILLVILTFKIYSQVDDSSDIIIDFIEEQPVFPGGLDSIWCFLESNAHKDTKEIAQLILEDKIRPTDDILTYSILDSIMAKKADDRRFYFQVFLKILSQADGALSEMIGEPASKYVFTYTEEFINLSSIVSDDLLFSWARFVGWQILSSDLDDPQKAGKRFIDQLNSNCKSCTTGEKSKLDSFNRMIIKSIEEGY